MSRRMSIYKLIFVLIVVALLVSGATFAFWTWTSDINKNVVFTTAEIEDYVVYDEGNSSFVGNFLPSDTYCESVNTILSFYKKAEAKDISLYATIKMDLNNIGENTSKSNDVYWVVTTGDSTVCEGLLESDNVLAYGTFNGMVSGETLTLIDNIEILLVEQIYTVWIWIDNAGTDLSNLSGEIIDVNVWTEITMKEVSNELKVNFDFNGGNISEVYNTPGEYIFDVSYDGDYQIELWGAQGGNYDSSNVGGDGGYTSGKINLSKDDKLYLYVGGTTTNYQGGYNGGGIGGSTVDDGQYYGGGGGATDVRLVGGEWNDFDSLKSRIMVAAGGAGTGYYRDVIKGGSGGGLIGNVGNLSSITASTVHTVATAGTQTSGGLSINGGITSSKGSFGYCGKDNSLYGTGCGSGYYAGGAGDATSGNVSSGAGGSSFISGHNGCDAISVDSTSDNIIHTNQSIHYSGIYFYDTVMIDGNGYEWTNVKGNVKQIPKISGGYYSSGVGHSGDGVVKITSVNKVSKTVIENGVYGELPMPIREKYKFVGWNTKSDGSGIYITEDSNVFTGEEHTLYAIWEYAILYLYNNGDENIDVTGGFTYGKNGNGSIVKNSTNIVSSFTGVLAQDTYGIIHTANKIDLTNYSKLIINDDWITSQSSIGALSIFGIYENIPSDPANYSQITTTAVSYISSGNVIDISSLSGEYYIIVISRINGTTNYYQTQTIKEMYLVK